MSREADDRQVALILQGLGSGEADSAWAQFLEAYSPLIFQVERVFEADEDHIADCFVFVCEQLSRKRFQRLRRFRQGGPARFSTWLRAVVHNLCLDWRRREFGRRRVFQSIARLPSLDREIFRYIHERALPLEEAFFLLHPRFPTLTRDQLEESADRIRRSLSPRQLWLLSASNPRVEPLESGSVGEGEPRQRQIPDLAPSPEALAAWNERRAAVARAVARLPGPARLLLRLRFEQELTLEQIARLTGLKDAQSADRQIRAVLDGLREELGVKGGPVSV